MDIFVVDDERIIAETLAIILRRSGYEVSSFYSAHSALQARSLRPRLLLTDYDMPGLDGLTLIQMFLADQWGMASILFTGNDLISSEDAFGWDIPSRRKLLIKPLHPAQLLEEVATLIGTPIGQPADPLIDFPRGTAAAGSANGVCFHYPEG